MPNYMVCLGPGNAEARYYWHDLKALIDGRGNHPSIYQFDTFNEQDMMHDFNTSNVVRWVKQYDNTRLVDTDSGGPANDLHVGDVDDLHVGGPSSNNPHKPGPRQYMMDGEYGNIEFWIKNHTWTSSENLSEVCRLYGNPDASHPMVNGKPQGVAESIAAMANAAHQIGNLSVASYVQLTDTEMECDGIISYDRTPKFSKAQIALIRKANVALTKPMQCMPLPSVPLRPLLSDGAMASNVAGSDLRSSSSSIRMPRWMWG